MFNKLRQLELAFKPRPLFDNIGGYDNYKQLFIKALKSEKPVHILLVGAPGTGKTEFLLNVNGHRDYRKKAYFTLGAHSTKAGIINELFIHRPRYLLIDELEHMSPNDKTVLLSLMQTGIISETKYSRTRNTELKTWVFATCNHITKMSDALLSRFVVLHFKKYSKEEFVLVAYKILTEQENVEPDFAEYIAESVFDYLGGTQPRDCVKVARLAKNEADVIDALEAMSYKGEDEDEE